MDNELSTNKRFYWLKLRDNFFGDLGVIALRRLPNGDTNCVIFLKMLLNSLNTGGEFEYTGILPSIEEEIAARLGEDEAATRDCIAAMLRFGIAERLEDGGILMSGISEMTGSEAQSTRRARNMRMRNRKAAQNDASSESKNSEECTNSTCEALQFSEDVSQCSTELSQCSEAVSRSGTEKRDKKKERAKEKREEKSENSPSGFARPTLDEVREYCKERKNSVDPEKWLDYYTSNGFMVGKTKMADWRASVRQWECNGIDQSPSGPVSQGGTVPSYEHGW